MDQFQCGVNHFIKIQFNLEMRSRSLERDRRRRSHSRDRHRRSNSRDRRRSRSRGRSPRDHRNQGSTLTWINSEG